MNKPAGQARPPGQVKPIVVQPKPKSNPNKPPETIDLSDDNDDEDDDEDDDSDSDINEVPANGDADSGEIMLEGSPETEEQDEYRPSTSKRRGRPRMAQIQTA